MGTCPTFCGKVVVSLPEGFTSPNNTSAMALPASLPPNQTFKIAGTFAFSQFNTNGLPVNKTSTKGLPVFANAINNSFCVCGISILLRLELSPDISEASPNAATIISDWFAMAKASFINSAAVR